MRPLPEEKSWLQGGYKANSWSRDQHVPPAIYARDSSDVPVVRNLQQRLTGRTGTFLDRLGEEGVVIDLANIAASVDLGSSSENTFYRLNA